jgi:hypothetical protein
LINCLGRYEAKALVPPEGPQHTPSGTGRIHTKLEKVKFPEFLGVTDDIITEAWLDNMAMCFALLHYTSNMKFDMEIFQLKGFSPLW